MGRLRRFAIMLILSIFATVTYCEEIKFKDKNGEVAEIDSASVSRNVFGVVFDVRYKVKFKSSNKDTNFPMLARVLVGCGGNYKFYRIASAFLFEAFSELNEPPNQLIPVQFVSSAENPLLSRQFNNILAGFCRRPLDQREVYFPYALAAGDDAYVLLLGRAKKRGENFEIWENIVKTEEFPWKATDGTIMKAPDGTTARWRGYAATAPKVASKYLLNCKESTAGTVSLTEYAPDGSVRNSLSNNKPAFSDIVPGSVWDFARVVVCGG